MANKRKTQQNWHFAERVFKRDLKPNEKLVLITLARYVNRQSGKAFPSIARLAQESGFGDRTVRQCLINLSDAKIIKREPRGRGYYYTIELKNAPLLKKFGSQEFEQDFDDVNDKKQQEVANEYGYQDDEDIPF
jgi:DNA-binding GntR family transcriptional regulator